MDEIDLKTLLILQDDARTPFTRIAQKLGVSDATIHIRVRKMEEMGLIEKFTILVNEEKIGRPVTTYVLISVDPGTVDDVCTKLTEMAEVYEVCEIHERYDVLVKVRGVSLDDVRNILVNKIRSIPHVVGSETYTVYKTWKRDLGVRVESPEREA